jgi:hypothetical protein
MTMTTARFSSVPRAPYTGLREGFEALMRKKDAALSGGAYARDPRPGVTSHVPTAQRSTFAAGTPGDGALGMGLVQASLAALTGAIRALSWSTDTLTGRATIDGVGSGDTYQMSFDDRRPDYRLFGGFTNGPAYQAGLLGLVVVWAQRDTNPDGTAEVIDRWWALVQAMDELYPRADRSGAWDVSQVKAACQDHPRNARFRAALAALADALAFSLRSRLPDLTPRGLYVQYDPCVSGSEGTATSAAGAVLLTLPAPSTTTPDPAPAAPSAVPDLAPEPVGGATARPDTAREATPDGDDEDLRLDVAGDAPDAPPAPESATPPATPPAAEAKPATPAPKRRSMRPGRAAPGETPKGDPVAAPVEKPAVVEVPLIGGAHQARIGRAFARLGDIFLYGVTATGKTMWAKRAAIDHGYGLEIVVFKPGVKDEMLYGTSVQDLAGRWVWQDGPIVRAARRAAAGERIVLLLDELPRGDKSVVAGTMDLMNVYSSADLLAQRLPVPAEAGPYRVVRVFDTQETLVFPAQHLKLVATANLGDKYQGMDLSDPAFRRRWTGGWLELAGYEAGETASILAGHLGLPATHALIKSMIAVDRDVQALQRKDESLVMTTNLATLITWGQEVIRLAGAPDAPKLSGRPDIKAAFTLAAQDLWVDMVCPLAGDRRDPEVYRELIGIVERHAPGVL